MQNPPRAILLENVVGFVPWLCKIRRYHKVAIWILRTNHRKPILKFIPWLTFPSHSWPLDPLTLTLTTTTTHGQPPGTVRMSSTFVECLEYLGDGGVCHWSWRFGSRGWSRLKRGSVWWYQIWNTRPWVSFWGRLGLFSGASFAIRLKNVNTPQSLKIAASPILDKTNGQLGFAKDEWYERMSYVCFFLFSGSVAHNPHWPRGNTPGTHPQIWKEEVQVHTEPLHGTWQHVGVW